MDDETQHPDIVVIGGSAGALEGICTIMRRLPASLRAAVLIVLHRPTSGPSYLVEIVGRQANIRTRLAQEGDALETGLCLISPPDRHLTVVPGDRIHLVGDGLYRAKGIDLLLQSLARTAGHRTVAVLLSGMLRDGTAGLDAIKAAGGIALVQSPTEAQYPDMPRNALAFDGAIDFVGPVDALADEICRRVGVEQSAPASSKSMGADA